MSSIAANGAGAVKDEILFERIFGVLIMKDVIKNGWNKIFPTRERLIDAIIDLAIDIILILIEIVTAPIVLPIKLAAHGVKLFAKTYLLRQGRKATKKTIQTKIAKN